MSFSNDDFTVMGRNNWVFCGPNLNFYICASKGTYAIYVQLLMTLCMYL